MDASQLGRYVSLPKPVRNELTALLAKLPNAYYRRKVLADFLRYVNQVNLSPERMVDTLKQTCLGTGQDIRNRRPKDWTDLDDFVYRYEVGTCCKTQTTAVLPNDLKAIGGALPSSHRQPHAINRANA